jgi:hypothetical protein
MSADFSNYALLGAYGEQDAIRGLSDVYFAKQLGASERKEIRLQDVRYVLVDFRLSKSLPSSGRYFEPQEPDAYRHVSPIDTAALAKFDGETGVDRIFDSGDIVIYDVRSLNYAP